MLRHKGKNRTAKHNLRLATILSFVAGMVNITGFLGVAKLTTNVTGHFAHLINGFSLMHFLEGSSYLLYILSFLAGSFISNTLIEMEMRAKRFNKFVLPILLESTILCIVTALIYFQILSSEHAIACLLLLAMGIQNSFVTKVSDTVVRTTHLTGLFTDLGIELSQLCFPQPQKLRKKLKSNVRLRFSIVGFFFLGGILASVLFKRFHFNTLIFAVGVLFIALLYDGIRMRWLVLLRRIK